MLVLSRKQNERLVIGGIIEVVVVKTGDSVRLGIIAPPEVSIDRYEIHERKLAEAAKASA